MSGFWTGLGCALVIMALCYGCQMTISQDTPYSHLSREQIFELEKMRLKNQEKAIRDVQYWHNTEADYEEYRRSH